MQKTDWCAIFKNGKVPSNFIWKILMTGFGKFLKDYMRCPIKNRLLLNRVSADSKMMLLIPSLTLRFDLFFDMIGPAKQRDFLNLSFTGDIVDY